MLLVVPGAHTNIPLAIATQCCLFWGDFQLPLLVPRMVACRTTVAKLLHFLKLWKMYRLPCPDPPCLNTLKKVPAEKEENRSRYIFSSFGKIYRPPRRAPLRPTPPCPTAPQNLEKGQVFALCAHCVHIAHTGARIIT